MVKESEARLEEEEGKGKACGCAEPRCPSFIAVVLRAEREVVVLFGVPGAEVGVLWPEGGVGGRTSVCGCEVADMVLEFSMMTR